MVWLAIVFILILLLALFLLNFYRNPERKIPHGNNIVSPADGKIIGILTAKKNKMTLKKGFIGRIEAFAGDIAPECIIISIFMSPFDVHVNRSPIEGRVVSIKHTPGKYFAAFDLKNSLMNEKNEIIMENRKIGKVKVIQIAGFLARRIICTVSRGEKVNKGQRVGGILLGSQVSLILPARKIKLIVRAGQRVIGGETIIANLK